MGAAHENGSQALRPRGGDFGCEAAGRHAVRGVKAREVGARGQGLKAAEVVWVAVEDQIGVVEQASFDVTHEFMEGRRVLPRVKLSIEVGFTVVGVVNPDLAIEAREHVVIHREGRVVNDEVRAFVGFEVGLVQWRGQMAAGGKGWTGEVAAARSRFQVFILPGEMGVFGNAFFDKAQSMLDDFLTPAKVGRGQQRDVVPATQGSIEVKQALLPAIGRRNEGREETKGQNSFHSILGVSTEVFFQGSALTCIHAVKPKLRIAASMRELVGCLTGVRVIYPMGGPG